MTELLAQPAESVWRWLAGQAVGDPVDGVPFNWRGLAFAAGQRVTAAGGSSDELLSWGRIAIRVNEALAALTDGSATSPDELSAMMVRSQLITRLGPRPGHDVLDPEVIVGWFEDLTADIPPVVAQTAAALDLSEMTISELRHLRRIKNALGAVLPIADETVGRAHPELDAWREIRYQLP